MASQLGWVANAFLLNHFGDTAPPKWGHFHAVFTATCEYWEMGLRHMEKR